MNPIHIPNVYFLKKCETKPAIEAYKCILKRLSTHFFFLFVHQ